MQVCISVHRRSNGQHMDDSTTNESDANSIQESTGTGMPTTTGTMKYDDLLHTLGEFGRYQKFQYFLVCLVSITSAFHSMNMVFVGPVPDHHCHVEDAPAEWENLTWEQQQNVSIPWEESSGQWQLSECSMYNTSDVDWEEGGYDDWVEENRTEPHECTDGWWYSQEYYTTTIVSEWDLVCDKDWLVGISSTIFFFGRLVGAFASGQFADRFGRRPVFFIGVACQVLVGCICAFSPGLYFFYTFYFLQGLFQVVVYLSAYVLGTEVVGPSYRKWAGMCINFFYAIGQMVLTGIAYGIREWRWIEIAISLPCLLFFGYYWFLPESIRWLLTQGRKEEAQKILETTARVNKVSIPDDVVEQLAIDDPKDPGEKKVGLIDLVRTWGIAEISINVWFNWFVNALVYYGLNLNTSNLHGDPYLNFFLLACVEIPALLVALPLLDRVGRRWLMFAFMMVAGAGCVATAFVPLDDEYGWVATTCSMIGKFGITGSYAIIYLFAAEVFPTVVRSNGMGIASVCARIGGMVAPLFLYFDRIWIPLPMLLFGVLSIVGGVLCLVLPETAGKPLPQSLEEMHEVFNLQTSKPDEESIAAQGAESGTADNPEKEKEAAAHGSTNPAFTSNDEKTAYGELNNNALNGYLVDTDKPPDFNDSCFTRL